MQKAIDKDLIFSGNLNPDYRRNPKTKFYCENCQRDIKHNAKHYIAVMREIKPYGSFYVPLTKALPSDTSVFLGLECAKKLPSDYKQLIKRE